jgi:hypothetical protein
VSASRHAISVYQADSPANDFMCCTVSSRGVLFLKAQKISAEEMQNFLKRFHTVAGAPKSSGLHIHPSINVNGGSSEGIKIQKISSEAQKKAGGNFWRADGRKFWASEGWHSE